MVTTEEMYVELSSCLSAEGDCEEIQARVNSRENAIQRRKDAMIICPNGLVAVCDSRSLGCGFGFTGQPSDYICVTEASVREMLSLY